jgi:hypothetical protein
MSKMNRAGRRKMVSSIANNVVKGYAAATEKKQYGFGLVVTNRMIAITFWRWTWVPWDRRLS